MKALSFLEWVDKRQTRLAERLKRLQSKVDGSNTYEAREELYNTYVLDVLHGIHFYNQKFSVDMLVNPIDREEPRYTENQEREIETEWLKSESLRLFDGWVKVLDNEYKHGHLRVVEIVERKVFRFSIYTNSGNVWDFDTLNEFITLANKEVDLQWNESNRSINLK